MAFAKCLPIESIGNGYGFPSSHSQYMGYFATFLTCHMFFKHRFASTGFKILDQIWRLAVYAGLLGWAGAVAYSRCVNSFASDPLHEHLLSAKQIYVPRHGIGITSDIIIGIRYSGDWLSEVFWVFRCTSPSNWCQQDTPHHSSVVLNVLHSAILCRRGYRSVMGGQYGLMVGGKTNGSGGVQNGRSSRRGLTGRSNR